jgi:serralysin
VAPENPDRYCTCISKQPQANGKAALLNESRWQSGNVIQATFVEGDHPELQARVRDVALGWTAPNLANLDIQFVDGGSADIRIAFLPGKGSWSVLGTQCREVPPDQPTMNFGWLTDESSDDEVRRVVLHEWGHALGLIHEHQNPKGGIKWNEPAVIADLSKPPNSWDEAKIRHNVLDHYPADAVTSTEVDARSIMMYPIPASWTLDGFSADLNDGLTPTDETFIHTSYP